MTIMLILCKQWSTMKVIQLRPTLCDPMDCTVHGILQARILEWVAVPFSRGSSQPRDRTQVSHIAGRFFTSWATREAQGNSGQPMVNSNFAFWNFPIIWSQLVESLSSVQLSSVTQSCPTLQHHWMQHTRLPCPSPTPRAYSNSCP